MRVKKAELEALVDEATVDAYGESEQAVGLFTLLEDHLALPFQTVVLGVEVTVERVNLTEDEDIVAVCRRGRERQRVRVLDVPLPDPSPEGWKWIEAYRFWALGWRDEGG
ncbi:MAG: calcium-binding protein [Gemmatimonadota bacterium]